MLPFYIKSCAEVKTGKKIQKKIYSENRFHFYNFHAKYGKHDNEAKVNMIGIKTISARVGMMNAEAVGGRGAEKRRGGGQ